MTPAITAVRMTGAAHRAELPLLVLGPSQGASAATLWTAAAAGLTDHFDVLAWDLPGQGHNRAVRDEPFTLAELAAGVLAVVDDVQAHRDDLAIPFAYAGVSVGGAVGPQLALDAPHRVRSVVLMGSLDVPDHLDQIDAPVLTVVGADDPVPTVEHLRQISLGVRRGALVELPGTSHLAPTERPEEVAMLIRRHVLGHEEPGTEMDDFASGWDRPGLDRRSRAIVTLAALTVRGDHEEVAAHLAAAVGAGLTPDEIDEVLAQAALVVRPSGPRSGGRPR